MNSLVFSQAKISLGNLFANFTNVNTALAVHANAVGSMVAKCLIVEVAGAKAGENFSAHIDDCYAGGSPSIRAAPLAFGNIHITVWTYAHGGRADKTSPFVEVLPGKIKNLNAIITAICNIYALICINEDAVRQIEFSGSFTGGAPTEFQRTVWREYMYTSIPVAIGNIDISALGDGNARGAIKRSRGMLNYFVICGVTGIRRLVFLPERHEQLPVFVKLECSMCMVIYTIDGVFCNADPVWPGKNIVSPMIKDLARGVHNNDCGFAASKHVDMIMTVNADTGNYADIPFGRDFSPVQNGFKRKVLISDFQFAHLLQINPFAVRLDSVAGDKIRSRCSNIVAVMDNDGFQRFVGHTEFFCMGSNDVDDLQRKTFFLCKADTIDTVGHLAAPCALSTLAGVLYNFAHVVKQCTSHDEVKVDLRFLHFVTFLCDFIAVVGCQPLQL